MSELFLKIVSMSVSASWLILIALGSRLVLKKAPRWVNVLLWGIVAVRLLSPFSIESAWSMIPSVQIIPQAVLPGASFGNQTGIPSVDVGANNAFNAVTVLCVAWLAGMLLMFTYAVAGYWRFRRKVNTAVLLRENIFQCEVVNSPFVLGMIQPKIYIPFKMDTRELDLVIAHEQAHIRRGDHWWKPLGFLLLTIHWFNPLVWLAYVLLCRDIEFACDEKVIKELDNDGRADYTQALVDCSMNCRRIAGCPLAFGEVGVKARVKSIMNYEKPMLWVKILAVIVCVVVAACFLTDPVKAAEDLTPGNPFVETHPEEATNPRVDPNEEKPTEPNDAERIAAAEAIIDELKQELARLQAEYEKMIEAEGGQ